MLSWRAGAVYKPRDEGQHLRHLRNFAQPVPGRAVLRTANTAIDPEKTYTFEAGTKWDLFERGF